MARRSSVPKFGEWENESNVPYTAYFDKARETRGNEKQGIVNPNDPGQYLNFVAQKEPEKRGQKGQDPVRPNQNRTRPNGPRAEPEQRYPRDGVAKRRNEQGFDASPLHRNNNNNNNNNQNGRVVGGSTTPVRPSARPNKQGIRSAYEGDDFSAAVPKFGDWDNNQESAENYTEKFNKFSQDRKMGSVAPTPPSSYNHKHNTNKRHGQKCPCFPWI